MGISVGISGGCHGTRGAATAYEAGISLVGGRCSSCGLTDEWMLVTGTSATDIADAVSRGWRSFIYAYNNYVQPVMVFTNSMVILSAISTYNNALKCKTLGRMRDTANWWAGLFVCVYSWSPASSSRRLWQGLATAVDSMRESIHAIRCDFLCLQGTRSKGIRHGRGKPVLICDPLQ